MNEKMAELQKEVTELVGKELERANEKFPLFASDHEGLAVISEELWESEQERETIHTTCEYLRDAVFTDEEETKRDLALALQMYAVKCAAELIQVAAMCSKFVISKEVREDEKSKSEESK